MIKKYFASLAVGGIFLLSASISQAASVTFAQFRQGVVGNPFSYTGKPIGQTSTLSASSVPIMFDFQNFLGGVKMGSPIILKEYAAILNLTATATAGESVPGTGINAFDSLTFTITAAPTADDGLAGKVLLRGSAGNGPETAGTLNATAGDQSASFKGSNPVGGGSTSGPNFVFFDSDVIKINNAIETDQNYAFSFTSLTPAAFYSPSLFSEYLKSFVASGTGTFAASSPVPEPGSLALMSAVLVSGGVFGVRRRRR